MLFNEGNCLIKGSIDAAIEIRVYVVIDTVPGRPLQIMDNAILDRVQAFFNDYAHQ